MEEETPSATDGQQLKEEESTLYDGSFFFGLSNIEEQKNYMQCTVMALSASVVWLLVKLFMPLVVLLYCIIMMEMVMMGTMFVLVMVGLLSLLLWLNRKTLRIDRQQVIFDGREFDRAAVAGFRTFDVEVPVMSRKSGPAVRGAKIGFDYGDGFVRYSGFYSPSEAERVVRLLNGYLQKYS